MTQPLRHALPLRQAASGYRDYRLLPPSLGDMLRAARLEARFTLRQAAWLAGISPGYLSRLERGLRCPRQAVASRLADALYMDDDQARTLINAAADDYQPRRT